MALIRREAMLACGLLICFIHVASSQNDESIHSSSKQKGRRVKAYFGDRQHPAKSCADIFKQMPNLPSGAYWLDVHDWTKNKTIQERHYCQNTLSNETKTGLKLKGQKGAVGVEDLSLGEPPPEPFDWEELTDGNWPLPVTPPTEEEMQERLKQAVTDYKEKLKSKSEGNTGSNIILNRTSVGYNNLPESGKISNGITSGFVVQSPGYKGESQELVGGAIEKPSRNVTAVVFESYPAMDSNETASNYTADLFNGLRYNYSTERNASTTQQGSYNISIATVDNDTNATSNNATIRQNPGYYSYIPVYNGSNLNWQTNESDSELRFDMKRANSSSDKQQYVGNFEATNTTVYSYYPYVNPYIQSNNSVEYYPYNSTATGITNITSNDTADWNKQYNSIVNYTLPTYNSSLTSMEYPRNDSLLMSNVSEGSSKSFISQNFEQQSQYLPMNVSGIAQSTGSIVFEAETNGTTSSNFDNSTLDSIYRNTVESSASKYNETQSLPLLLGNATSEIQFITSSNGSLYQNTSRSESSESGNSETSKGNVSVAVYGNGNASGISALDSISSDSPANFFSNYSNNYLNMQNNSTNETTNTPENANYVTQHDYQNKTNDVTVRYGLIPFQNTIGINLSHGNGFDGTYELTKEPDAYLSQKPEAPKLDQMVYTNEETRRSRNGTSTFVDHDGGNIGASRFIEKSRNSQEQVVSFYGNANQNRSDKVELLSGTLSKILAGTVKRGSVNASLESTKENSAMEKNVNKSQNSSDIVSLQNVSSTAYDHALHSSETQSNGDAAQNSSKILLKKGNDFFTAMNEVEQLNSSLSNLTNNLDTLEKHFHLFNNGINQTFASLNESMQIANDTLTDDNLPNEYSQSSFSPKRKETDSDDKQEGKVRLFMINWRKVGPLEVKASDTASEVGKTESSTQSEVTGSKEKTGLEKEPSRKNKERDGLFVRPGLNRGSIQMAVNKDDINATKQRDLLGVARGNISKGYVALKTAGTSASKGLNRTRNTTSRRTSNVMLRNATRATNDAHTLGSLDIRGNPADEFVNNTDPDELNRGLWTTEAMNYAKKADEDFAKQQKYIETGGDNAFNKVIKDHNRSGGQNVLRDPSRADATKEKMKEFYDRNDEIVLGKGKNGFGGLQKVYTVQNGEKPPRLSKAAKPDNKTSDAESNFKMSSSTSTGAGSETGTNTWAQVGVGTKVDSSAGSQEDVTQDPNLISSVEEDSGTADDNDNWEWNDETEEEEYPGYNRPQGLGLWSDSGTGTGVGVSIGANAGANGGSDTSSETDTTTDIGLPTKWPNFGFSNGFGMGMGTNAGSQSGAETMTETSVNINTDVKTESQSKTGSQAGSKSSGSKSKYKWKSGPKSGPQLIPLPKASKNVYDKTSYLVPGKQIQPNANMAHLSNALSLKELSPFKAAPQLGIQTNTRVSAKVQTNSNAQAQSGSNAKVGSKAKNTSHQRLHRAKQRLSAIVNEHNNRLAADTENNPLRKMKQTQKTPMQLKMEEIAHKTRNKPRGSKPKNINGGETANQASSGDINPKKTEASVDIYYKGKNNDGVDINAGISISDGQRLRKQKANGKMNEQIVESPYLWYERYPYDIPSTADINRRLDSLPYAYYTPQMRSLRRRVRAARQRKL